MQQPTFGKKSFTPPFTHTNEPYTRIFVARDEVPGHPIEFSPDGKKLYVGGLSGTGNASEITVWNFAVSQNSIDSWLKLYPKLDYNPKLNYDAPVVMKTTTTTTSTTIRPSFITFTNPNKVSFGKILTRLSEHTSRLTALGINNNNQIFASAATDELFIWKVETLEIESKLQHTRNVITELKFNADGNILAVGDVSCNVSLWVNRDGTWTLLHQRINPVGIGLGDSFRLMWLTSSNGLATTTTTTTTTNNHNLLMCTANNGVQVIDANSGNVIHDERSIHYTSILSFTNYQGYPMLFVANTNLIQLDPTPPTFKEIQNIPNPHNHNNNNSTNQIPITSMSVSVQDNILATCSNPTVICWSLPHLNPLKEFNFKSLLLQDVCFDPLGQWLIMVGKAITNADCSQILIWERDETDSKMVRELFRNGIKIVGKHVHPSLEIVEGSIAVVSSHLITLQYRLLEEAERVRITTNEKNLTVEQFQKAIKSVLVRELIKHGVSESLKAIDKVKSKRQPYASLPFNTTNDSSAVVATTTTTSNDDDGVKLSGLSLVETTNIMVEQIRLMNCTSADFITEEAVICLIAVLEYIVAEILELGGNAARDLRDEIITPYHIYLAIYGDVELNEMLYGGGGNGT
jgi:hypothetical protein